MDFYGHTTGGIPTLSPAVIIDECKKHKRFVVRVEEYDEQREISEQQIKYLHAVVFPTIARESHCSKWQAEFDCKRYPGRKWLIKSYGDQHFVLSKKSLSVKQCGDWIENIWDWAQHGGIHIPLPDKDWREHKEVMP